MMPARTPTEPKLRRTDLVEGVGASASFLCLLHCLALPILAMLLPGLAHLAGTTERFHTIAPLLIVPAALAAFGAGYRQHRASAPALLGAAGVLLLLLALMPHVDARHETIVTVAGSLTLVTAHLLNWRLRRHAEA